MSKTKHQKAEDQKEDILLECRAHFTNFSLNILKKDVKKLIEDEYRERIRIRLEKNNLKVDETT